MSAIQSYPLVPYRESGVEHMQEFLKLKTSRERIEFILKSIGPLNLYIESFNKIVDDHRLDHSKNARKSFQLKNEGISYFNQKHYMKSIQMLTKAILLAPFDSEEASEELCQIYGYKSWAHFELMDYRSALSSANHSIECLETMEMCFHKIDCLTHLGRSQEALQTIEELFQSYNSEELDFEALIDIKQNIFEQMSNSSDFAVHSSNIGTKDISLNEYGVNVLLHPNCQLKSTERKGRHGVATDFIPAGEVVLLERPSCIVLTQTKLRIYCTNCYKKVITSFWPCNGCDEVVFCDKSCFNEAFDTFHKYECGFLGLLYKLGTTYVHTYRMISRVGIQKAFQCEEHNNYFDFDTYLESKRQIAWNPNHRTEDNTETETEFETEFEAYYSLVNNHSKQEMYRIKIDFAIEAALFFNYTKQLDFNIEDDFEEFVAFVDICFQNHHRVQNNMFGWVNRPFGQPSPQSASVAQAQYQRDYVGNCVCTVSALLNHSCSPNIFWWFNGPEMVFNAKTDIKPGEEMCVTYGPQTGITPFLQRQHKLKYQYFFDCDCEGCLRDSKTILCLRCEHCSGPVVPVIMQMTVQRDVHCLECGHLFENFDQSVAELSSMKDSLGEALKHLNEQKVEDFDHSFIEAVNQMETLIGLVCTKSKPLRNYLMKLVRACVKHNRFGEAVQCFEYFGNAIQYSNCILSDLQLLTTCYYMHLHENEVKDTKQWNTCFQLYSELISGLKKKKKSSKARAVTAPDMNVVTNNIRNNIKEKKNEFQRLRQYYDSLFSQM